MGLAGRVMAERGVLALPWGVSAQRTKADELQNPGGSREMVVEGRGYSCLILSIIGNCPVFLGTVIFIVSAF